MNITILRQRYIGQGIHGVVFRAEGPDPRDATYEGHAIVGSEGALSKQWQRHVMDDKCLAIEAAVHARVFQVDP